MRESADSRGVTRVVVSPDVVVATVEPARRTIVVASGRAVPLSEPEFQRRLRGRRTRQRTDLDWARFTNPAAPIRVEANRLACSDLGYEGDSRVLEPGNYPSLPGMTRIWSARQVWRTR
ncbi:MAG TPA: hypothetical protein VFR41_07150 [Acidimicrobiia bacterium]|nr:hypothetical protein [Acidimicrobiia bacterium]